MLVCNFSGHEAMSSPFPRLQHLKDLEERVVVLEQETKDRDAENAALKQLLEK